MIFQYITVISAKSQVLRDVMQGLSVRGGGVGGGGGDGDTNDGDNDDGSGVDLLWMLEDKEKKREKR